jgi:O-antigen/teichoic acid export membrane protein
MMVRNHPSSLSIHQRLSFLAKDSVVYGSAAAITKAFALLTFPLLARHFTVAEYGVIDYFSFVTNWLGLLIVFGQDSAVARFFYEDDVPEKRSQIISQSLALQGALVLLLVPALWLSSNTLARHLHASREAGAILRLVLLQLPFLVATNFSQGLLRWAFRRTQFLIVSVGAVASNAALLILALTAFDARVTTVFQIGVVVQAVFAFVGLYFVREWIVVPARFDFLRRMLPYALPYGVICCIGGIVPLLERYLVGTLLGVEDLGLYAAGAKVAMLLSLLVFAFQSSWGPFSLAIHKEADAAATYNVVLKGFSLAVCIAVLVLSALSRTILTLLATERYANAAVVVFPLAMALAIQSTGWITEIGISISKRSHLSLYSYAAFLLASAVSIWTFSGPFGFVGVAFGVMIGYGVLAVVGSWLAQRVHAMAWDFKFPLVALALTLAVGLVGTWMRARLGGSAATAAHIAGVALLLAFGWLYSFSERERTAIIGYVRK